MGVIVGVVATDGSETYVHCICHFGDSNAEVELTSVLI